MVKKSKIQFKSKSQSGSDPDASLNIKQSPSTDKTSPPSLTNISTQNQQSSSSNQIKTTDSQIQKRKKIQKNNEKVGNSLVKKSKLQIKQKEKEQIQKQQNKQQTKSFDLNISKCSFMEIIQNQQVVNPIDNEHQQLGNKNDFEMLNIERDQICKEVTESMSQNRFRPNYIFDNQISNFSNKIQEQDFKNDINKFSQIEMLENEKNEKHYKKFDFFYRRTAFRSMTEFYKGLFKPILDKWREGERKSTKNYVQTYLWQLSELDYYLHNEHLSQKSAKQQTVQECISKKIEKLIQSTNQIEVKIHKSLKETFQRFTNGQIEISVPLCDADKKILKQNARKLSIFDSAYRFCDDMFFIQSSLQKDIQDYQHGENTPMSSEQLIEFVSRILSIVLSHHFQKQDIQKLSEGCFIDFHLVRDTMYKYSKKAEERFFRNSTMAYFFIQFAQSEQGKFYLENKLSKNIEQLNQNQNQISDDENSIYQKKKKCKKIEDLEPEDCLGRQIHLNERILSEIQMMSNEALEYLKEEFINDVKNLFQNNQEDILQTPQDQQLNFAKEICQKNLLSFILINNLKFNTNDVLLNEIDTIKKKKIQEMIPNKPLIDSILEDISKQKQDEKSFLCFSSTQILKQRGLQESSNESNNSFKIEQKSKSNIKINQKNLLDQSPNDIEFLTPIKVGQNYNQNNHMITVRGFDSQNNKINNQKPFQNKNENVINIIDSSQKKTTVDSSIYKISTADKSNNQQNSGSHQVKKLSCFLQDKQMKDTSVQDPVNLQKGQIEISHQPIQKHFQKNDQAQKLQLLEEDLENFEQSRMKNVEIEECSPKIQMSLNRAMFDSTSNKPKKRDREQLIYDQNKEEQITPIKQNKNQVINQTEMNIKFGCSETENNCMNSPSLQNTQNKSYIYNSIRSIKKNQNMWNLPNIGSFNCQQSPAQFMTQKKNIQNQPYLFSPTQNKPDRMKNEPSSPQNFVLQNSSINFEQLQALDEQSREQLIYKLISMLKKNPRSSSRKNIISVNQIDSLSNFKEIDQGQVKQPKKKQEIKISSFVEQTNNAQKKNVDFVKSIE